MWSLIKPNPRNLRVWQLGLLVIVFAVWHALTAPGLIPPFLFDNDRQAAFFFGEPVKVLERIWVWFVSTGDIYLHLWITLLETVLAFGIGTVMGLAFVGAVVGEYLGSARGVGYLILQAEGSFDINTVMAGILVLTVFALVLDGLVGVAEKRLMKWQPRAGESEKL